MTLGELGDRRIYLAVGCYEHDDLAVWIKALRMRSRVNSGETGGNLQENGHIWGTRHFRVDGGTRHNLERFSFFLFY